MKLQVGKLSGSFQTICVDINDTLNDALKSNNILPQQNSYFIPVSAGKVLCGSCTIQGLGLKDNQKIILTEKARPASQKHSTVLITQYERDEKIQNDILIEKCRIADIEFQGWECDSRFNLLMQDIYNEEKEAEQLEKEESEFTQVTVISKSKKISDQPLPHVFLMSEYL
ncbi:hypothetical protein TVAG_287770 [Trichomonas vaginalis G3]|uniref:Ubiquitin-like domain-containing protein n=1 Tax=Trichomonas vaginalis (strain ATCC PRA-98 / G3) TaxID=412133 RepID=A2ER44_TRIV3|nr:hypothetical protein TVAGG3_0784550 [Trichomonas vaginalis G3]EAY04863.1 hypothetical protein TVAG_287770 [Trichomonas vaginalis G3]KAI5495303.1 hypothetical protein TVAGG3_0784550 [Trichomonas vaginalis G3]|eukprot:XP_001317086.1 hypothetical protein [Trichomonas vaginalis G3]